MDSKRRDVFQAIADPVRRDIIQLLSEDTLKVNSISEKIAEKFKISRPAVSKHLKILEECGVIHIQQKGRERFCRIEPKNLIPAFLWIDQYRTLWEARLDSFEAYLYDLQTKNKTMNNLDELKDRTLTIEKTLNAPIQLVWEAWTKPEHIAAWWGPKGMQTEVIEHDFKVGGKWKYSMTMPDGNKFIAEGEYKEIVEFQKIISSADFKPMTEGVEMQVLLEEKDNQTQFTFHIIHATAEYCQQQEKMGFYNGWGSVFERLVEFLEEKMS